MTSQRNEGSAHDIQRRAAKRRAELEGTAAGVLNRMDDGETFAEAFENVVGAPARGAFAMAVKLYLQGVR